MRPPQIVPVILSGGAGTRLWPLSRALHPKQLLPVTSDASMLQVTVGRLGTDFAAPIVVGGEEHRFLIVDQLSAVGCTPAAIVLEPEGRNTAAAIALAAHVAISRNADAILLVLPSDHVVADPAAFNRAVATALPAAAAGDLVAFGIAASSPETGYGYIEIGAPVAGLPGVHAVDRFVEKPDATTARGFVASGRHAWNGGIFVLAARSYLEALTVHSPAIATQCAAAIAAATCDGVFIRPETSAFLRCPNVSIDYAVMEHTSHAAVVPVEMGWSDVGSWAALWEIGAHDADGNLLAGDVIAIDAHDCLVRVDGGPAVAIVGADDLVVVSTRDAVLVVPRSQAQQVKQVVEMLKARGSTRHVIPPVVERPWGSYTIIDRGSDYTTRRVVVRPGARLSVAGDVDHSACWIVASGTAATSIGGVERKLTAGLSAEVPTATPAVLANVGRQSLVLIEVDRGAGRADGGRFADAE